MSLMKQRRTKRVPLDTKGGMEEHIRDAAIALVGKEGSQALSLRALAPTAGVTFTAPQYHFGSIVGLLGAVAAKGFDDLGKQISIARSAQTPNSSECLSAARAHARFGLEEAQLYQAMHDPRLWQYDRDAARGSSAKEKEGSWFKKAEAARNDAFRKYESAVIVDQNRGLVTKDAAHQDIAHLIALLVDGYIFQVSQERVNADATLEQHLQFVSKLLDIAMHGLAATNPPV